MASAQTENGISQPAPVICVFCGASNGRSPAHLEAAKSLAKALHQNGAKLVYGGGDVGLMGMVARTLVELSGPQSVHGIIPRSLMEFERKGENGPKSYLPEETLYGKTTVVGSMHERKQLMAQEVLSGGPGSGFVVLSGGFGTLEEAMENATWNQLSIHALPVIIYNVDGYWDGLLQWVRTAVESGFISAANSTIVVEAKSSEEVMEKIKNYQLSKGRYPLKWEQAKRLT